MKIANLLKFVCLRGALMELRQRSGEGVVRRNGCPKGCFCRVRFFSAPSRFALQRPENLKGEEEMDSPKHPFGQPFLRTTAFSAPLARSDLKKGGYTQKRRGTLVGCCSQGQLAVRLLLHLVDWQGRERGANAHHLPCTLVNLLARPC